MSTPNSQVIALFNQFICGSRDGYAIFDSEDVLIYANQAFVDIFCVDHRALGKLNFEDILRIAFKEKRGINIDSTDLESWLQYVDTVRRKREFRIFEVDLVDGRWMLFSEQLLPTGELLVHTKDLTSQKVLETQLRSSVDTLSQLALTDELTQIANRRCFVDSVVSELSRCKRARCESTMMLIDLDNFKQVNDTYGHFTGDEVLKVVARILKDTIREYDILGRIGGEEFAIFLGQTKYETALKIAERVRKNIESAQIDSQGQTMSVTTSIGLSTQGENATFESLYTQADEALYQAKAMGRNCVEVFLTD